MGTARAANSSELTKPIRIRTIKAGTLYGYNLGVRDRYDYIESAFGRSQLSDFLLTQGMKVYPSRRGKDQYSTRDVICLDFDFGSRSYEEERDHVMGLIADATKRGDDEAKARLETLLVKVEERKGLYRKMSKDDIRTLFYRDGVDVQYTRKNKQGEVVSQETIHYRKLERNASKAKIGQVIFIRDELYEPAIEWLTMGINGRLAPGEPAKLVELSAYAPLTTSTVEDMWYCPVEDILILKDQESVFHTIAEVVRGEDYETTESVVDAEKTEAALLRAIKKNKLDINGEPIYHVVRKKIPVTKKRCVVSQEECDVTNVLWDGMGLVETSCLPAWCNGMALLRNHFFKACVFRTRLQQFFKDWCTENGYDYETHEVEDLFGVRHRLKDVKIVTTENSVKFRKFYDYMGGTPRAAYDYWCDRVRDDGNLWGIVKTDHPSKLGDVQQMSYQMVNSLPCSRLDVKNIAQTSIDYVERLKVDNEAFADFLTTHATAVNHYEMLWALLNHNPAIAESDWYRRERSRVIADYVQKLRGGKITVEGDNLTCCGNPSALLLHSVGEDWRKDPTLCAEGGAIQCYTRRFEDGEYLCGIRSPNNSSNNLVYLHNRKHPLFDKYFEFSANIVAVNCIGTDIQSRMNGMD